MDDPEVTTYRHMNQPVAAERQNFLFGIQEARTYRFVNQPGPTMMQKSDNYTSHRFLDQPSAASSQRCSSPEMDDQIDATHRFEDQPAPRADQPTQVRLKERQRRQIGDIHIGPVTANQKAASSRWIDQPASGQSRQHNGNVYSTAVQYSYLSTGARPMFYMREIERLYKACNNTIEHYEKLAKTDAGIAWIETIRPILQSLANDREKIETRLETCLSLLIAPIEDNDYRLQEDLSKQAKKLRRYYEDLEQICVNFSKTNEKGWRGQTLDQKMQGRLRSCHEKVSKAINEYVRKLDAQISTAEDANGHITK